MDISYVNGQSPTGYPELQKIYGNTLPNYAIPITKTTWNIRGFDGQLTAGGIPDPLNYSLDGMYGCVWVAAGNKTSNITPADVVKIHSANLIGTAPVPVFTGYGLYYFWATNPITYNTITTYIRPYVKYK